MSARRVDSASFPSISLAAFSWEISRFFVKISNYSTNLGLFSSFVENLFCLFKTLVSRFKYPQTVSHWAWPEGPFGWPHSGLRLLVTGPSKWA